MPVLIFADQIDGSLKKSAAEVLAYGAKVAAQLGTTAEAIVMGTVQDDLATLGKYGIVKVHHIKHEAFNTFNSQLFTAALAQAVEQTASTVVVLSHNTTGRSLAGRLSVRLQAAMVPAAVSLPETADGFIVKKVAFSGKAFAHVSLTTRVKIISLNVNAYKPTAGEGKAEVVEMFVNVQPAKVKVLSVNKVSGKVPLSEATRVVSGGRGLKRAGELGYGGRPGESFGCSYRLQSPGG